MNIGPTFGLYRIQIRLPYNLLSHIRRIFFLHVSYKLINERVYRVLLLPTLRQLIFLADALVSSKCLCGEAALFFCPECHSCSKQQRDATIHRNCFTRVVSRRIYGIRVTDIERETNQ